MNLITVIPLTKNKAIDSLTYFTGSDIPVGAIVSVPIRSKDTTALVVETTPVEDVKNFIRNADFQVRKLGKVKATSFFPAPFMKACETLANFYATTLGSVIRTVTSSAVLENIQNLAKAEPVITVNTPSSFKPIMDETFAIQGDEEDRMSTWRSLIRQEFAQKRSLIIYIPSYDEATNIHLSLAKGIEDFIFTLHGDMTEKKIIETWNEIAFMDHPIVIIATSIFTNLPRNDIETIIIEKENNRGWVTMKSPFIDMRHALETIYRKQKKTVYIADTLLRTTTLSRVENNEITTGSPFKWRSVSNAKDTIIDMKAAAQSGDEKKEKRHFKVLSDQVMNTIKINEDNNTHLFIMTSRRGLSSVTVCEDCETIVSCLECGAPVVLHASKENDRNFFMCHNCGSRRGADEMCSNCHGWRLTPLGIGTDRVVSEIKKEYPQAKIIVIDSDTTKTEKQIRTAVQNFYSKPGSILVGTELALLHLHEPIEHVAVASIDSLLALPDFSIQERIMYMLVRLRSLAKQTFVIQTRRAEEKVFELGSKGNLGDFYRTEMKERKRFLYPPFSTLIKISVEGKKSSISF